MNTSVLEDLGLTSTEIRVFITLLELGETKAVNLIKKTKLQSSSVYNAIHALIEKGLVSYIKKSTVKHYRAAEPESVLDYIELKKREYMKLLPELKSKQRERHNDEVEYYRSLKGIKTILSEMIKNAQEDDTYRTFAIEDARTYTHSTEMVFTPIKQLIREKGLKPKGIFHESTRKPSSPTTIMQKRYLDTPLPPNTVIVGDCVALLSWTEEPTGILIRSQGIAQSYKDFFDSLWKIAKR